MIPDAGRVEEQLNRIIESQDFATAQKMKALLRYLVDAELEGRGEAVKGYSIGVDVFDRGENFDPNTDSIVRVQIGRLRRMLTFYYLTEGVDDPVRIAIPKGGNRVSIAVQQQAREAGGPSDDEEHTPSLPRNSIPVAVLPFTDLSGDQGLGLFNDGLCDELTTQLAGVASLTVVPRVSAFQYRGPVDIAEAGASLGVSYIVDGAVRYAAGLLRVSIQLIDVATGKCDWAGRFERVTENPFLVQDEIVAEIMGDLRGRLYSAAQLAIRQKPVEELSAWQLAIRAGWLPNDEISTLLGERRRMSYARLALDKDPAEGRAHSVMADKLGYLANYDPPSDTAEAWEAAEFHARKALELRPVDADVTLNVALFHWHAGNMQDCLWACRRALALEPSHVLAGFAVDFLPFATTIAPPAVIKEFQRFDAKLPPDSATRWVMQSWLCQLHLNNGDFESVVEYGLRTNGVFALPDIRFSLCAALVQLGNSDVAARLIREAAADWPTLDLGHFANVVIPRRFGRGDVAARIRGYYEQLARRGQTGAAA